MVCEHEPRHAVRRLHVGGLLGERDLDRRGTPLDEVGGAALADADVADDITDEAALVTDEAVDSAFSFVSVEQDDRVRAVAAANVTATRAERWIVMFF